MFGFNNFQKRFFRAPTPAHRFVKRTAFFNRFLFCSYNDTHIPLLYMTVSAAGDYRQIFSKLTV
jgi:hypothetical protein